MNLKKSIFSYILGAVFAVFCGLAVFVSLETAPFLEMSGRGTAALMAGTAVYLLLAAAVFLAFRRICQKIVKRIKAKEKADTVCGIVLPVLVLLAMAAYLAYDLFYHTPLSLTDDTFYRAALVVGGIRVPFFVHGASFLYTCLLHGMLLIFGNTPFAGAVLQIALFFCCLLLLYAGVRSYAGTIPAVVSMAAFGFFSFSFEWVSSLTPELFYLAFYLLGFCLTGLICKRMMRSETLSFREYMFAAFTGICIGFLVYLDFYSISLYFYLTALLFWNRRKQALQINAAALLGGIAGFVLSVLVIFLTGRMDFTAYLKEYAAFSFQNAEVLPENILQKFPLPGTAFFGTAFLAVLAFFNVPSIFFHRRNQNGAFILNLLFGYLLRFLEISGLHSEQMTALLGWSMLAGLGVYGAVRPGERTSENRDADRKAAKGEKADGDQEMIQAEEKKEQEKPAPGEPLSNPLPVPKRKNRPRADFDHPVKEADMKFDVEVADHDDFDV